MVEDKRIHSTKPFIFFTGNVNLDKKQRKAVSGLHKQLFQLSLKIYDLKERTYELNSSEITLTP